jgi:hypothetical protein
MTDKQDLFQALIADGRITTKTEFDTPPLSLSLPFNHLTVMAVFLCAGLTELDAYLLRHSRNAYACAISHDGWLLYVGENTKAEFPDASAALCEALDWCHREGIEWIRFTP